MDISYNLIKLPLDYLVPKTHCLISLLKIYETVQNEQLLRQILNHVEYYIQVFLPNSEKFNVEKRSYTLNDYKFNQESTLEAFDQPYSVQEKAQINDKIDQILPTLPQDLIGARSINLKSFGDVCIIMSLKILKKLQVKYPTELDDFFVL